jgi:hypothetical protein
MEMIIMMIMKVSSVMKITKKRTAIRRFFLMLMADNDNDNDSQDGNDEDYRDDFNRLY